MKILRYILLFVTIFLQFPESTSALSFKQLTTASGITMSPFLENISLNQTKPEASFIVTYSNNTNNIQELDLTTEDFGSLNRSGGVLLEGSNLYTKKFGLSAWMQLSNNVLTLNPNSSESLTVTIVNQSSLTPGGHYGAIVAKVNNFNNPSNGNLVTINQQLVNLVMIDKTGGEHYDLSLTGIKSNGNWLKLPNSVVLTFENPGNVQVVPRGVVRLLSPSNKVIAQGIINSESSFILPESFQDQIVNLTSISNSYNLPGIYHLSVDFRYDGYSNYYYKEFTLSYIDLFGDIVILLVISITFIGFKIYKKRVKKQIKNKS